MNEKAKRHKTNLNREKMKKLIYERENKEVRERS